MDPILEHLHKDSKVSHKELAELLKLDEEEVSNRVADWEKDGTILGYQAVIDRERAGDHGVAALIDVKITPERGGGFDRLAERIARFDQVKTCILISGGYDLLVLVEGSDLQEVARFVAEKLATLEGVLSTATHFQLKIYKQNGFMARADRGSDRLPVSP